VRTDLVRWQKCTFEHPIGFGDYLSLRSRNGTAKRVQGASEDKFSMKRVDTKNDAL
jgi:hypothetical protein